LPERCKATARQTTFNNKETVFYRVCAATVAMQWFGKHVSTIEAVLHAAVQRSYLKKKRLYDSVLSSEFSVEDSHGKFVDL
jgi:hypothetical protein